MWQAGSEEVSEGEEKLRAPERWHESSERGLDDVFLIAGFFCRALSFSVLQGRLRVARGHVELRLRRFQEGRVTPELQNSGLRALEEA